jgi:predicted HD superfamily hydrolase involved in NAD metabolism
MPEERYLPFLANVLTPRRLDHSLGVMQVMGELAEIYNLDRELAHTAGLLHDAAKDLPPAQQKCLIQAGQIRIANACETNYVLYLHAPVGAYFVQKELGIQDELILGAIATHCYYGESPWFHHPLAWCLRFADILEPSRNWSGEALLLAGARQLRSLAYGGKLAQAATHLSGVVIQWYEEKGFPVHPDLRRIHREIAASAHSGV